MLVQTNLKKIELVQILFKLVQIFFEIKIFFNIQVQKLFGLIQPTITRPITRHVSTESHGPFGTV